MATTWIITGVTGVTLFARRVQVPVFVTLAQMATTCIITGVTGVMMPVRRVQVLIVVIRVQMATTPLINGVISVHILGAGRVYTKTVAIRVSVGFGDIHVTTRVL